MMNLFTPVRLNQRQVPNRVVRSATHEGLADDRGHYTPELTALLRRLAANRVGLILSGHAYVSPEGRVRRGQAAADHDACIPPWRQATAAVHAEGGLIFLQLAHAGGSAERSPAAFGPSPFAPGGEGEPCRAATPEELARIPAAFAAAARRAREAGFDGVQIHAAHGYLLSQFLSGFYNHREDAYGGTPENRARLLYEVYAAVRAAVGADYPVLVKLNAADFVAGGLTAGESRTVALELARRGLDGVELSGGIPEAGARLSPVRQENPASPEAPVYYEAEARALKNAALPIPLLLVGGIRYPETAERLLATGVCELISLSRPLIRDPELAARWARGEGGRSECVSCDRCFRPIMTGRGCYCPVAARSGRGS